MAVTVILKQVCIDVYKRQPLLRAYEESEVAVHAEHGAVSAAAIAHAAALQGCLLYTSRCV